ncbi:MAG: AAA family ATPase [Bacteroidia bacterium]|nr:AAA family ATPase [Bacteroidia bacterium]
MQVPGYSLKEEYSAGPGWRMFRGIRVTDNAAVLVKIASDDTDDQGASPLLLGEHAVLSQSHSAAFLSIQEIIHLNDFVALVHEDFRGSPLSLTLDGGPLPVEEVIELGIALAQAAMDLHSLGLLHGLLQPSGILIERRPMRIKVTNLFLSQPHGLPTVLPPRFRSSTAIVPYISPEQTGRIERVVDGRSDLYSIGVILYQSLTGWTPFRSNDPMEVIYAHLAKNAVPPHEVDSSIPEALSRIIMALLMKDPMDRYQSAMILQDDLLRWRTVHSDTQRSHSFEPRTGVTSGYFELPQRLVGRDTELAQLTDAWERCTRGIRTSLILDGYAGVGKSALVQGILPLIVRHNASFLRGKADQLQRDTPYAALSNAIRDFITQLLMENREQLDYWQQRFRQYLDSVAAVIARFIPEMEFFLGSQLTLEAVPQAEAVNRFREGMGRFFEALSSESHPLVFFLDDLQWVDGDTLQVLRAILDEQRARHVLFIGAVRGHELTDAMPATDFLRTLSDTEGFAGTITLDALSLDRVNEYVSMALHIPPAQSLEFSEVLYLKTRGNPFFLRQFLSLVHEKALLRFDEATESWRWSLEETAQLPHTENVVLLLTQRMQTWSQAARDSLAMASVLGSSFALSSVAVASGREVAQLEDEIRPAIEARLLLPMEKGQKPMFQLPGRNGDDPKYRFLHDRVQQAAFALIPEDRRASTQLTIGRRLLDQLPTDRHEEYAFVLADQFNAGRALIETHAERIALARLNILAGIKAGSSVAFGSAVTYFRIALELLGNTWESDRALLWTATREIGRMEYALGNLDAASRYFETMSAHARTPIEEAEALAERVHLMIHFGKFREALELGRRGLVVLGHHIPERVTRLHVLAELIRLRIATRGRTPEDIAALPEMTDDNAKRATELMTRLLTAAYFASAETIGFFNLRMMRLVARFGTVESAAYIFSQYGLVLGAGLGRHSEAYHFAHTGIRMMEGTPTSYWKTRVYLATAAVVNHWTHDVRESIPLLDLAMEAAKSCGDTLYELYPGQFKVHTLHFLGTPIAEVLKVIDTLFIHARKHQLSTISLEVYRQFYRDLQGESSEPGDWHGAGFDEDKIRSEIEGSGDSATAAHYYILRMEAFLAADRLADADAMLWLAKRHVAGTMGQLSHIEYHTSRALVAAEKLKEGLGGRSDMQTLRRSLRALSRFEKHCPENFASRRLLLAAELAAISGDALKALRLYDQSLEKAKTRNDFRIEALTARSATRTCVNAGLHEVGKSYARTAVEAFSAWGAYRYADACFQQYLRTERRSVPPAFSGGISSQHSVTPEAASSFDLGSLLKATSVITEEIHLARLVEKLLHITVENAGAERGTLLLEQDGDMRTHAHWDATSQRAMLLEHLRPEETPEIVSRIVRYVERTKKQILLDTALTSEQFGGDADIQRRGVQSVLCIPVLYKSALIGILYLENNLNPGVFSPARVEFLQLLFSQIASALENARLYAGLDEARRSLEEYSIGLEKMVAERTQDLERRSEELQQALDHLQRTQAQLIQAEKLASLGELTAGVAHEIQNPLNFIRNFSELCVELTTEMRSAATEGIGTSLSLQDDLATLHDVSKKIHDHGLRIERIVRGMLEHSRSGSLTRTTEDVHTLIGEALSLCYHGLRAKDDTFTVAIETRYDDSLPAMEVIAADLSRVFINIIDNSFYYLKEKARSAGSSYFPSLSISSARTPHDAEFRFRDNGPGIPPEALQKVFQPFYTTKPSGVGTGLGLSLSYTSIVEGHRGTLSVKSAYGEWTEVIVRLPLA